MNTDDANYDMSKLAALCAQNACDVTLAMINGVEDDTALSAAERQAILEAMYARVQTQPRTCYFTPMLTRLREALPKDVLARLAIDSGDVAQIKAVVAQLSPDMAKTLLASAATRGQLDVLKLLLARTELDFLGVNILGKASFNGQLVVVQLLLADGRFDANADDGYALRLASEKGYRAVVRALLAHGVEVNVRDGNPIRVASENGHLDIVDMLLAHGADPTRGKQNAVRVASQEGNLAVLNRLLEDPRVDPSAVNNHAIAIAAHRGHLAVVARLLDDVRVDPSDCGRGLTGPQAALRFASENGHVAVVERLLRDPRVRVDVNQYEPIRMLLQQNKVAMAQKLLASVKAP